MVIWTRMICCLTVLTLFCGCQDQATKKMASGGEAIEYEALDTFDQEVSMPIGYPLEMGDAGSVKTFLNSDEFTQAVSAFESAELPSDLSEKQEEKAAIVSAAKALGEKSSGSKEEIQAAYDSLKAAISDFRET